MTQVSSYAELDSFDAVDEHERSMHELEKAISDATEYSEVEECIIAQHQALDIPSYTPEFELKELVNRDMLRYFIGNPTAVHALDKNEPKTLYARLLRYAQKLMLNNRVTVTYNQADYHAGRCYAEGVSLQNLPKTIRHPLTYGLLYDLDIVNCHCVIYAFLCKAHGISCQLLQDYVDNRTTYLNTLSKDTCMDWSDVKNCILALINGGKLTSDNKWLKSLEQEIVLCSAKLLELYPGYKTLKRDGASRNTPISLLLQDIENWAIQIALRLLDEYKPGVLMYDGIMTELKVPASKRHALSSVIESTIQLQGVGLKLTFIDKAIPPPAVNMQSLDRIEKDCRERCARVFSSYAQVKESIELKMFKLNKPACIVQLFDVDDDNLSDHFAMLSVTKVKESMQNVYYYNVFMKDAEVQEEVVKPVATGQPTAEKTGKTKKRKRPTKDVDACEVDQKPFVHKWLRDPDIKLYDKLDFCPPPLKSTGYNLWRGFAVARLPPATDKDREIMNEWIIPFLRDVLCNKVEAAYKYLLNFLAQLFQSPGLKINTSLVALGEEGCGKNRFTTLLTLMIGVQMCMHVSVLAHKVFGRFANPCENRLLLVADEIEPKEMREYAKALMDLITNTRDNVERKGMNSTSSVHNLVRAIFTTNDADRFMKLPPRDRKFSYIDCSDEMIGKIREYWAPLMRAINTPGVRRAFYDLLMNIDITGFNFETQRYESNIYKTSKLQSTSKELQFLKYWVMSSYAIMSSEKPIHMSTSDLFEKFGHFCKDPKYSIGKCLDYSSNIGSFGITLAKVPGFIKNARHGDARSYTVNREVLIDHLISKRLLVSLEKEWLLTHKEGLTYNAYVDRVEQEEMKSIETKEASQAGQGKTELNRYAIDPLKYTSDAMVIQI
jgi:Family of unknown function (DUF5906)